MKISLVTSQLKYSKNGFSCLQLDLYPLFYPECEQEAGFCTFPISGMTAALDSTSTSPTARNGAMMLHWMQAASENESIFVKAEG